VAVLHSSSGTVSLRAGQRAEEIAARPQGPGVPPQIVDDDYDDANDDDDDDANHDDADDDADDDDA
jgi:hypothetical protein